MDWLIHTIDISSISHALRYRQIYLKMWLSISNRSLSFNITYYNPHFGFYCFYSYVTVFLISVTFAVRTFRNMWKVDRKANVTRLCCTRLSVTRCTIFIVPYLCFICQCTWWFATSTVHILMRILAAEFRRFLLPL